jgi:hypothetical protein
MKKVYTRSRERIYTPYVYPTLYRISKAFIPEFLGYRIFARMYIGLNYVIILGLITFFTCNILIYVYCSYELLIATLTAPRLPGWA